MLLISINCKIPSWLEGAASYERVFKAKLVLSSEIQLFRLAIQVFDSAVWFVYELLKCLPNFQFMICV
ncbi:hypothetical protein RchiOBHm_Chr2g0130291 [Rosa chinensis]|uniref:Uncharacterized protein n=1 Tax=Rosa chinensis TaxID=74649 RepID=A0A2P6RUS3_ROSCH|nr:hypothetical protein RchiOBHm_Chr2g0130291 [Rosa chinensis]